MLIRGEGESQPQRIDLEIIDPRGPDNLVNLISCPSSCGCVGAPNYSYTHNHDEGERIMYETNAAWRRARKYFGIEGNIDMVLHHKDETLRHTDYARYLEWRIEDLEVMTREEHTKHHCIGQHFKHKDNSNYLGKRNSLGRHFKHTEETKRKISEAHKGKVGSANGKHWFNNGEKETYAFECPEGYQKGRLKRYAELTQKDEA